MNKVLFLILLSASINTAMAKDSTWKLCVGDVTMYEEQVKLVVNVYEHRNNADGRQTDLTMIYGGHVLQGVFDNSESDQATVTLKNDLGSLYRGLVNIDYENDVLTLRGRISLNGSVSVLAAPIKCTTLEN
jgi:hypothetical protein